MGLSYFNLLTACHTRSSIKQNSNNNNNNQLTIQTRKQKKKGKKKLKKKLNGGLIVPICVKRIGHIHILGIGVELACS